MSYMCLMLLGCGGVGKTCLLCGLKNQPCPEIANSTLLADLQTLKSLLINRPSRSNMDECKSAEVLYC